MTYDVRNVSLKDYAAIHTSDFYKQIEQFVYDLKESVDEYLETESFLEDIEEDIELKGLEILNSMTDGLETADFDWEEILEEYGSESRCYDYETKSRAKVKCKEAIESAVGKVEDGFRGMQNIYRKCHEVLFDAYEQILRAAMEVFFNKFRSTFEDYVSLDCKRGAKEYALSMKKDMVSQMIKMYNDLQVVDRLHGMVKEESDVFFSRHLDVQKYFGMCTYDCHRDNWCYDLDDAFEQLNNCVTEYNEYMIGFFFIDEDKVAKMFAPMIEWYRVNLIKCLDQLLQEKNMLGFMEYGNS